MRAIMTKTDIPINLVIMIVNTLPRCSEMITINGAKMAIPNDDRDSVNKAIEGDNNTLSCKYGEKK